MSNKTPAILLATALTAGLLLACGLLPSIPAATSSGPTASQAAGTVLPQPLPSPRFVQTLFGVTVEGAQQDAFRPLETYRCAMLGDAVQQAFHVAVRLETAAFTDPLGTGGGTACRIAASGSGQDFAGLDETYAALRAVLQASGWQEDSAYAAGGATGIGGGFRDGNALALVTVSWAPAPGTACPTDQPVSGCTQSPEERLVRIAIDLAQR